MADTTKTDEQQQSPQPTSKEEKVRRLQEEILAAKEQTASLPKPEIPHEHQAKFDEWKAKNQILFNGNDPDDHFVFWGKGCHVKISQYKATATGHPVFNITYRYGRDDGPQRTTGDLRDGSVLYMDGDDWFVYSVNVFHPESGFCETWVSAKDTWQRGRWISLEYHGYVHGMWSSDPDDDVTARFKHPGDDD